MRTCRAQVIRVGPGLRGSTVAAAPGIRTGGVASLAQMFRDRRHAGALLGERVRSLALSDPVVLGLPRGGVVVAAEVARALGAPLDVLVVRKLGAPGNPELGIGAIAEDGITVLNDALIARLRVSPAEIEAVAEREQRELVRRTAAYRRGGQPLLLAQGVHDARTVLVRDASALQWQVSGGE